MNYLELPLAYQEQVNLLQTSGLGISDKNHALSLLKKIGYYRLAFT
jgi:abortive infection bacteriophage resistance protein